MQITPLVAPKPVSKFPDGVMSSVLSGGDGSISQFSQRVQQIFAHPGVSIHDRLGSVLTAGCAAFEMECGVITHLRKGRLRVIVKTQQAATMHSPKSKALSSFLSHHIIEDRAWLLIDDVECSPHLGQFDLNGGAPRRFVGFPLIFDGNVYGTVEFSSSRAGRSFASCDSVAMYLLSAVLATPLALLADY